MKFPELSREGTDAHVSAVRRLESARSEQRHQTAVLSDADGVNQERSATSELAAANQELAAREAWLHWVERGY